MDTLIERRLKTKENLNALYEVLKKYPNYEIRAKRVKDTIDTLRFNDFEFVVAGEWSSGKSTLLNSLLFNGEEILPVGKYETTSAIISINKGDDFKLSANGETIANGKEDVLLKLQEASGKANDKIFELTTTSSLLSGISVVDTPGINDIDETRSKITEDYIRNAKGVIVVSKIDACQSEELFNFIGKYADCASKFVFVINNTDSGDCQEIDICDIKQEIEKTVKENVGSFVGVSVFCVNAKTGENIEEIKQYLADFIYSNLDEQILKSYKDYFENTKDRELQNIDIMRKMNDSQRIKRINELEYEKNERKKDAEMIKKSIESAKAEIEGLFKSCEKSIGNVLKSFCDEANKCKESFEIWYKKTSTINDTISAMCSELQNGINCNIKSLDEGLKSPLKRIGDTLEKNYSIETLNSGNGELETKVNQIEISSVSADARIAAGVVGAGATTCLTATTTATVSTCLGSTQLASIMSACGLGSYTTTGITVLGMPAMLGTIFIAGGVFVPIIVLLGFQSVSKIKKGIDERIGYVVRYVDKLKEECNAKKNKLISAIDEKCGEAAKEWTAQADKVIAELKIPQNGNADKLYAELNSLKWEM